MGEQVVVAAVKVAVCNEAGTNEDGLNKGVAENQEGFGPKRTSMC
jgi:hypothetical protein